MAAWHALVTVDLLVNQSLKLLNKYVGVVVVAVAVEKIEEVSRYLGCKWYR